MFWGEGLLNSMFFFLQHACPPYHLIFAFALARQEADALPVLCTVPCILKKLESVILDI